MKILLVGCGAVGQVLGLHLQKAGVKLAFYARPGSAERLRQALNHDGLPLFQISRFHRQDPITHHLDEYQVVTDVIGSQRFKPDQIWFTTPSPVYYTAWFREFLLQVPSERVVCFAPEGGRPEFIPDSQHEDRFVFGGITFISWQGDLAAGGGRSEAVSFWIPPLLEIPLIGADDACSEVAGLLKKVGLRVSVKPRDFVATQATITAVLTALVTGLELCGWSLAAFRRGSWLKTTARASHEMALSQLYGGSVFTRMLLRLLLTPAVFFFLSVFLPLLTPFDLEKYLQFHYLKTRNQTLALLALFIRDGERWGQPTENVRTLLEGLRSSM